MRHISPIIEITNKCNMACKYCYAGNNRKNILDIKQLNKDFKEKIPLILRFTDEVISYNKSTPPTKFFFHGGEPLLISVGNWREILEGKGVIFVNPYMTSQTCSNCGKIGSRYFDNFFCSHCGFSSQSDFNASCNLRRLPVTKPNVSDDEGKGQLTTEPEFRDKSPLL